MLTMYEQITIQTLRKHGNKIAQIARQLGCHRNTVTNILDRETVIEKQTRQKSSIFDPYKEKIKELFDKKVTRWRIHEILQDEYQVHATYDSLRKYMRKHFPKKVEVFGVQLTNPGEVAEIDFGYLGLLPGSNGKLVKTWGFVVVLGYSRKGYFTITHDQKLETLCKELENACTYLAQTQQLCHQPPLRRMRINPGIPAARSQ